MIFSTEATNKSIEESVLKSQIAEKKANERNNRSMNKFFTVSVLRNDKLTKTCITEAVLMFASLSISEVSVHQLAQYAETELAVSDINHQRESATNRFKNHAKCNHSEHITYDAVKETLTFSDKFREVAQKHTENIHKMINFIQTYNEAALSDFSVKEIKTDSKATVKASAKIVKKASKSKNAEK